MPIYPYRDILPQIDPTAFVHPDAVVIGDVTIGPESSLWPGVVVRGDVNAIQIGARTNVQDGSVLHVTRPTADNPGGTPLIIGDDVLIGHRVSLHACTLNNGCMIGIGAIILDRVVVGEHAMVAAGSLVSPEKTVPSGELWVGSPARSLRPLTADEKNGIAATTANYIRLAQQYRDATLAPESP